MKKGSSFQQGMSLAFRVGTELIVATLLGALMGYALDKWLGSRPWFMLVGVLLGGAAGCLNAYMAAQSMEIENNDDPDSKI